MPFKIDLQKNLRHLGITYFQLVDLGILIGTDYFPGIKGIGPKKALILIRKYDTIEKNVFYERYKYDFSKLTTELLNKIRKIFLFPDVNEYINNIYWNFPNNPKVINLLCKNHHLNMGRVSNTLTMLVENYRKCRIFFKHQKQVPQLVQTSLDQIF